MSDLSPIVGAYDIRGVVPAQLDVEVAHALGCAAAVELGGTEMVVGRDMRPSSEALAEAFMRGVRSQGVGTVDIGLASTDMLYYASGSLASPGAMFTASHNPARYNGIKLCRAGAEPVSRDTGLAAIKALAEASPLPAAAGGAGHRAADMLEPFAQHVRSFVDTESLASLKVAIDAGNGMAGHVVPAVFDGLAIEVVPLYFELDGTFPNHPADPLDPDNLVDVAKAVRDEGCDIGLAFDGDADRVFCVDETGAPVSPSIVTAAIADRLLDKEPGATVLHNLICSRIVPETIEAAGGRAVRTRVGHSYIKAVMAETNAVFAGEHSGHYYFRDNFRADSGLIAAVVLLEALGDTDGAMSALAAPYDRYAASGEINVTVADQAAATARVAEALATRGSPERIDGLTVAARDWWLNLRASNTEPLLRLNVEAVDRQTVARIVDEVLAIVADEELT